MKKVGHQGRRKFIAGREFLEIGRKLVDRKVQ
jgi:hypothetical protein